MTPARRHWLQAALAVASAVSLPGAAFASDGLPATIARLKPSVLPVGTFSPTDSPRFGFRGTGFVVGDGTLVATNHHVLPEGFDLPSGPRLAVLMRRNATDAEVRPVRVVATDRDHDLALLKFEGPPLAPLKLDDAASAKEGQPIALMGYPIAGALGFSPVTHRGIVSALTQVAQQAATARQLDARAISRLRDGSFEVLQLDATAFPGNSGGPVFDPETGVVTAIVNMVYVKGSRESALSNPTGITYAIPVRWLRELLAQPR